MTLKDCLALADKIREINATTTDTRCYFTQQHIDILADVCSKQFPAFASGRWKDYIAGKRGVRGGLI